MRSLALYGPRMCWFQGARRLLTGGRIGCLIGLSPGEPIVTQIRFDQAGCFWPAETGFFKPRRVPASAPAIGRSFHAWPHALSRIRPLLAAPLAVAVPFC